MDSLLSTMSGPTDARAYPPANLCGSAAFPISRIGGTPRCRLRNLSPMGWCGPTKSAMPARVAPGGRHPLSMQIAAVSVSFPAAIRAFLDLCAGVKQIGKPTAVGAARSGLRACSMFGARPAYTVRPGGKKKHRGLAAGPNPFARAAGAAAGLPSPGPVRPPAFHSGAF
jgi:hypothetical protein